jgi:hypothetical protein
MEESPSGQKWYYRTSTLIIAFLCVLGLALPLLWFNPRFSQKIKIIVSIIMIILTYIFVKASIDSLKTLSKYYQLMYQ